MAGESVWERLRGLERRELIGLVVIAVLIVGGALFWYARSLPTQVRVDTASGPPRAMAGPGDPSASPTPSSAIVVYVAGWVRHPGVYEFRQGERVIDAIKRAGGARWRADLTSINLAALLTDSMQIVVARQGQASSSGVPGSGSSVGTGGGGGPGNALVNLNTATLDQLESLPGIGPALAQRILAYREQHGPFRRVEDLLNVSGIGAKRLADLRPKVTV